MRNRILAARLIVVASLALAQGRFTSSAADHFAATVIDYRPGDAAILTNPYAAVGRPGNIVAAGTAWEGSYALTNPHYEAHELAQIGAGGELTLKLARRVAISPDTLELGLFTNTGLAFTGGTFGEDSVHVEVSDDGVNWTGLGEVRCDFPASAFSDPDATAPSEFGKPHGLTLADTVGRSSSEILADLDGAAGGTWLDLSPTGLAEVAFVRLSLPPDAAGQTFELAAVAINSTLAGATPTTLSFREEFATDPLGSRAASDPGHASFADQALSVSYDLSAAARRTAWPLGAELSDADSFTMRADFTIDAIDFDTSNFGQLSFGLINATTTGNNRTSSPSDSWDLLTVDYFPNEDFTTFTPTVIGSQAPAQTDAFANLGFPLDSSSLINEPGEIGQLPTGTPLSATLDYDATTRVLTLRLAGQNINAFGPDPDNDDETIQYTIPERITFTVDTFAILCWQESSGGGATLTFQHLSVATPGPAPNYYTWADAEIAAPLRRATHVDADGNGLSNLLDYGLGGTAPLYSVAGDELRIDWQAARARSDVQVSAVASPDLRAWSPADDRVLGSSPDTISHQSFIRTTSAGRSFLRLEASRP